SGTGFADVISFDMGGTTAKACVVRGGRPEITHEFHVGGKGSFGGRRAGTGVPIKTPAIDLAEVGAGGGSIAWLDTAGALRVGPHSAGSSPGPACYGLGGSEPTVTDANLVLGYLSSASIPLSPSLADKALDRLAGPLGVSRAEAAYAVHEIVSASMASAVHVVTVQRGIDPRGFALVAFGGAGPMHAAGVAERFGIATVVVSAYCGVASAAGLLAGDLSTDRVLSRLDAVDPEPVFAGLAAEAAADLGVSPADPDVRVLRSVDVRFKGQSHDLTVEWSPSHEVLASRFFERYQQVYGIAQRGDIELVGYRVRLTTPADRPTATDRPALADGSARVDEPPLPRHSPEAGRRPPAGAPAPGADSASGGAAESGAMRAAPTSRRAYFPELDGYTDVPVHTRDTMGGTLPGPAIIEDAESTIVVPPSWTATLTPSRAVHLTRGSAP
ncbi:hydantoinase/oxoprolinase family protein, partial [Nonomuraea turkmeniaca]